MQKITGSVVTIGLTTLAAPVAAQDFYAGLSFGSGNFSSEHTSGTEVESSTQSFNAYGGARFDIGSGFFAGVEIQGSNGSGYQGRYPYLQDELFTYQGELHLGYTVNDIRIYGFLGLGETNFEEFADELVPETMTLGGIGVEIPLHENISARVEHEMSRLSIEDTCCGSYDVEMNEFSLGLVYNF